MVSSLCNHIALKIPLLRDATDQSKLINKSADLLFGEI